MRDLERIEERSSDEGRGVLVLSGVGLVAQVTGSVLEGPVNYRDRLILDQVLINLGNAEGAAAAELLRGWGYACSGLLPGYLEGGKQRRPLPGLLAGRHPRAVELDRLGPASRRPSSPSGGG